MAKPKLRMVQAMAEKAEIELAKLKDETLTKSEVKFAIVKAQNLLWSGLDRLANKDLPPMLKGKDPIGIQQELIRAFDALKVEFEGGLGELGRNGDGK